MVGTAADLAGRLDELAEAGLGQVILLPPLAPRTRCCAPSPPQVTPLVLVTPGDGCEPDPGCRGCTRIA